MSNYPWWSEESGYFGSFYLVADTQRDTDRGSDRSVRARTIAEVDGVVRLLELEPPAKVLDCPCGYGRHSIELAARGFITVGVDLNSIHLEKARATPASGQLAFKKGNMVVSPDVV